MSFTGGGRVGWGTKGAGMFFLGFWIGERKQISCLIGLNSGNVIAMTTVEIERALSRVREESDLSVKSLLMAALVSELFRERGFEPIVVGGSAIEFYTDGAYMSGDTDLCWCGWPVPSMEERIEIMQQIPGVESHGGKSWEICGLWIDLLGELDHCAEKAFSRLLTPVGEVLLIPVEDALIGRVYSARKWMGGFDEKEDQCAKKLMAVVLAGGVPIDWDEALRVAELSKYRCGDEFKEMRLEVEAELAKS